jgi:excisionase family DNA binding protein
MVSETESEAMKDRPEFLTKKEAAEILHVSKRQIERYIAEGKLEARRLSHKVVLIRPLDLQRFVDRSST